jgi:hypothetical protein
MESRKLKAKTEDPSALGSTTTKFFSVNACSICDSMFSLCDFPGDRENNLKCIAGVFCGLIYITILFSKGKSELERISWLKFRYSHLQWLPIKRLFNLTVELSSMSSVLLCKETGYGKSSE